MSSGWGAKEHSSSAEKLAKNSMVWFQMLWSRACGSTTGTIGALMIRIGFWGLLYYNYKKEHPENSIDNY